MYTRHMWLLTRRTAAACLVALSVLGTAARASAEPRRLALVIGLSEYEAFGRLPQAASDAIVVGDALEKEAGFIVTRIVDEAMPAKIFRTKLNAFVATINRDDVVLIYYAGHAVQDGNANYLLPEDFPKNAAALKTRAVTVDEVLDNVAARAPQVKILVLDACRNNPLMPDGPAGLAEMNSAAYGVNTHIEFAAGAGQAAKDGLFASHFASELGRKGADLDDVFRSVRAKVTAASLGEQTTFSNSRMELTFYFVSVALPDPGTALANLERIAAALPRGDLGQTASIESLIRANRSLAGIDLLQGLSLVKGKFDAGDFSSARMTGADLSGASLRGSDLTNSDLSFATLNDAVLESSGPACGAAAAADGRGCTRLDGATFRFADLKTARVARAHAADSDWFAVRAQGVKFTSANLQRAGFMFADLRNASFDGADLSGAFFIGSDLRGASFKGATLDNTDFTGAIVDRGTFTREQSSGACETTPPPFSAGQFAYAFSIVVVEVIPNSRFDGGLEYARFIDKQYPYDLLPAGLPKCKPRELRKGAWYPIWKARGNELLRSDVAAQFPQKLLQQAGRRAAVRTRIDEHFAWLYKPPQR